MDEIRNLSVKDVSIYSEYMSVFIPKRKNDQYREGHTSLLARSHKATCPVSILVFYYQNTCDKNIILPIMTLLLTNDLPLFQPLFFRLISFLFQKEKKPSFVKRLNHEQYEFIYGVKPSAVELK